VARGVACVLGELLRRRAAHDAAAHAAREAQALALDVGTGVLPEFERFRIVAEIDADLLENRVGVVLEELEPPGGQRLVVRNVARDVGYEGVAARGAGRDLGIAATRTAGSRCRGWLLLIHRNVLTALRR